MQNFRYWPQKKESGTFLLRSLDVRIFIEMQSLVNWWVISTFRYAVESGLNDSIR